MHGKIPHGPRESASAAALTGIERAAAETVVTPPDWRDEVASRVQHYRSRRGKYNPDLCLPLEFQPSQFEEQRRTNRNLITSVSARGAMEAAAAISSAEPAAVVNEAPDAAQPAAPQYSPTSDARPAAPIRCVHPRKIIEFPRPSAPLRPLHYELAEPVLDAPRILEAPAEQFELLPEVPAITLDEPEPAAAPAPEEQTTRVPAASVARRVCCGVLDALAIAAAMAIFSVTFWKITAVLPPMRSRAAAMVVLAVPAVLWIAYQYCFLVFGRATIGMRVARLEAVSFEGAALDRKARRRRALAMLISLIAAGLGFAWALLDDERLCWHDRISRSYLAENSL